MIRGEKLDLDQLSLIDWKVIKAVYNKNSLSLNEIRQETRFTYRQIYRSCNNLKRYGLVDKTKSSCVTFSAPSSKALRQIVMDRYYDIMEV